MPHKILFLDQFGTMGGGQRVLLDTLRALDAHKFRPAVALNGKGDFHRELRSSGTLVLNLPLGNYHSSKKSFFDMIRFCFRTIFCSILLTRAIRRHRIDLLYANGPRTFACATLAGWVTKRPVVWHLHNVFPSGIVLRLMVLLSRGAQRILVCSRTVAEPFLKKHPPLQSKIKLIYNSLPHWPQPVSIEAVQALRRNSQLQDGFICFGILGRITPFKGQSKFIEAAHLVLQQFPQAYFFVIGSPAPHDPEDQSYYRNLLAQVKSAGLESKIFFVEHQTEVEPYYELLDVVVLASQGAEASPKTIIEAMYLGKPVIAPAQEGIREMVEDGHTGFLVDEALPHLLASKMLDLIHNPEHRSFVGQQAKSHARTHFSWERFENEIRQTLTSCLKGNEAFNTEAFN